MGAMQNNNQKGSGSKQKRGSVRNADRLAAFANGAAAGQASWGECSEAKLQAVINGITHLGGAVTFGLSRDKGAYSLTLLLDQNRKTLWFNGDADLDQELDDVAATLAVMADEQD